MHVRDHDERITSEATTLAFLEKHKTELGIEVPKVLFHYEDDKYQFIIKQTLKGTCLYYARPKMDEKTKKCRKGLVDIYTKLASLHPRSRRAYAMSTGEEFTKAR